VNKGRQIGNPFPGLRPFNPDESHLFFGRDGQSDELLRRLRRNRFLAVVGTSGSGKSSLVRAGLLPLLHGGFMDGAGSHWRVALFRPGAAPIGSLAEALSQPEVIGAKTSESKGDQHITVQPAIMEATLRRGSLGLVETVRQCQLPKRENLLLVVDQFEELFRLKCSVQVGNFHDEGAAFVKLLLKAVGQEEVPIYVVITMRSDFLGDCARFRDLPEAINDSQYLIPRMTREQRRQAITGPVAVAGAEISPRLVQRLLNDVGDDPDQLPILQHALMRTWECWRNHHRRKKAPKPLDIEHYEKIGGMDAALSRHADEAFAELSQGKPDETGKRRQELAERLFRCITELGSDNREMRRPSLLKDICEIVDANMEEMKPVIETFRRPGRSFLMPPAAAPLTEDSLIDISHESLIRQWEKLGKWVDEEAKDRKDYVRLAEDTRRYEKNNGSLLQAPELKLASDWQKKSYNPAWAQCFCPDISLVRVENFLKKSKDQLDADIARKKAQQKSKILFAIGFAAIVSLFWIAILLGFIDQLNSNEAQPQRNGAQKSQNEVLKKAYDANYNLASAFEKKAGMALDDKKFHEAWLYTLEALKQNIGPDHNLPTSMGELMRPEISSGTFRTEWTSPKSPEPITSLAISPDGKKLASGSEDNTVQLWDVETGKQLTTLTGHSDYVLSVAFSPDGGKLASGSKDKTVRLWDVSTGTQLTTLKGHSSDVSSVAFSPDGKKLASGSDENTVRLWDISTGTQLATLTGHSDGVFSVTFSPDGKKLASGSEDNTVRLWDVETGKQLTTLKGHSSDVRSVAFSPDGKKLASGSSDHTVRLWDVSTGTQLVTLTGHLYDILSVAFSPDGKKLASGSKDKTVRLWDVGTGRKPKILTGHLSDVLSVAFSPDGEKLASGSKDKTVRLWDISTGTQLATLTGHSDGVFSVTFSPDGKILASGSRDTTVWLRDVETGKQLTILTGHSSAVRSVAFSPDGEKLASGSSDHTVRLWDLSTGKELGTLKGHSNSVESVAFSPDGKILASGSSDHTVRLWDLSTGKELGTLKGHSNSVESVAFSPDGKILASGSRDNTVRLWDVSTGKQKKTLQKHSSWIFSVAFSPDGKILASGSGDNTVLLWDLSTGTLWLSVRKHSLRIFSVDFIPEGEALASGSDDQTVPLFKVLSGKVLATLKGHSSSVLSVAFSPDGKKLASGSLDNTVRLWDVATGKELATLKGHSSSVLSVAFSPDGKILASGLLDNTVRLWDFRCFNIFEGIGIRTPTFDKIYRAAFELSPYRLEGLNLVLKEPASASTSKTDKYKKLRQPRPLGKPLLEWILENIEEE
jgi:WD40 repeat protein